MKAITKTLLVLTACIRLTLGSPVGSEDLEKAILPAAEDDVDYRLNDDFKPLHYDLELEPYFVNEIGIEEFTFKGNVKITLQATKDNVKEIVLHQNSLVIEDYYIIVSTQPNVKILFDPETYDSKTDKWTIKLANPIANGTQITLEVNYIGYLRDDMNGFYRSYYNEGGEKVWMASTQFQQTEARRAFPCFDEPGFKSTFRLTMIRPKEMSTVSNTDIEETVAHLTNPDKEIDTFMKTPPMSTYLLAFIVSNYEGNFNTDKNFGVYARPEAKNFTERSLKFGEEMLKELGTYLNIDYYSVHNVTKMDMAAIPDFSAGAMENWGLLTYRETNILFYANDTPSLNEQRIVAVIAHEQAHQWFGDLLTCKWWSETWLNEGFARYFQYFGTQMLIEDWDLEEQFVVENLQQSMQLDSTLDIHAMTNLEVKTKADASNMFDNISYNKAASIIRMLSHYIGLEKFKETLQFYLNENRDRAVTSNDLFSAIENVNPNATASFFAPWTQTPGFPLVTAKLNGSTLNLTQKRFLEYVGTDHNFTQAYNIPITYSIDSKDFNNTTPMFVYEISDGSEKIFNFTEAPAKYYILNNRQTGFYRVNYEKSNWMKIKEALMSTGHGEIDVMNRAQIVDDLFNLAKVGIVEYSTAIDIIRYIKKELHYIPWLSAFSHGLTYLSQRVSGEANQKLFSWFIQDIVKDIYDHLTFEAKNGERRTDVYNRVNIISWACKYGHEACISKSKEHFNNFRKNGVKVPKDQRAVVYCNAVRSGGADEFNFLYDRFKTEDISAEILNLLAGMSCTKNQTLITKYLDYIVKFDDIRPQDRATAINNMLNANPEGPDYIYEYITTKPDAWKEKIGSLGTLTTIASRFTTEAQFKAYEDFLKRQEQNLGTSYTSMLASSEKAKRNLVFDSKYMKDFIKHLETINSAEAKTISVILSMISIAILYVLN